MKFSSSRVVRFVGKVAWECLPEIFTKPVNIGFHFYECFVVADARQRQLLLAVAGRLAGRDADTLADEILAAMRAPGPPPCGRRSCSSSGRCRTRPASPSGTPPTPCARPSPGTFRRPGLSHGRASCRERRSRWAAWSRHACWPGRPPHARPAPAVVWGDIRWRPVELDHDSIPPEVRPFLADCLRREVDRRLPDAQAALKAYHAKTSFGDDD